MRYIWSYIYTDKGEQIKGTCPPLEQLSVIVVEKSDHDYNELKQSKRVLIQRPKKQQNSIE